MRLPNVKILFCWPSRMQIYGFVENHTFLEQFVGMGVPAQFSNLGVPAKFSNLGVPAQFSSLGVPAQFSNLGVPAHFSILWLCWPSPMMGHPAHFFHLMEAPTMRLPNVKCCSVGSLECIFMALFDPLQ